MARSYYNRCSKLPTSALVDISVSSDMHSSMIATEVAAPFLTPFKLATIRPILRHRQERFEATIAEREATC